MERLYYTYNITMRRRITTKLLFLYLFSLISYATQAQTPQPKWQWVSQPISGQAEILDLQEDGEGNIYVCGVVYDDLDF